MVLQQGVEFQGLVVSRRNYRENDMLVEILTDRFGFKTFFVRGAKKRGFRLASAILPFSFGTYLGSINDQGLSFLDTTRDVSQYQNICQDIYLNAYATYLLSLGKVALKDDVASAIRWYQKLQKAVFLIDEGFDAQIITNIIEVQLLECFGVKPFLESCVICHETQFPFDFSEGYGGLLCQKHWYLDTHRLQLDQRTIYYLRLFSVVDLDRLASIKVKSETKKRLAKTLDQIYHDQVGVKIKAKEFLRQMQNMPSLSLKTKRDEVDK